MAVETTTVTGKILMPSGSPPPSGSRLIFKLSQNGRAEDGSITQVIGGSFEGRITSDGSVMAADGISALKLVPNDAITPSGTYYIVDVSVPGGLGWKELWNVTTSPDPVEVGDIQRLAVPTPANFAPTAYFFGSAFPTASATFENQIGIIYHADGHAIVGACLKSKTGVTPAYEWITFAEGLQA